MMGAARWPEPFMEHRLLPKTNVILVDDQGDLDCYHWEELN